MLDEKVVAAASSIARIDSAQSSLSYRGYDIHDLVKNARFEETAYLLHFDKLPNQRELDAFNLEVSSQRGISEALVEQLKLFPKQISPMSALLTAVSMLPFFDAETNDKSIEANHRKAIRLMARVPTLVACIDRLRKGLTPVPPLEDPSVGTAANFLYMLKGRGASAAEIDVLDKYFTLLAEHDLNVSTFAARVAASTLSDMYSAVAAAMGTLKGDLHGSANVRAMEMLLEIGSLDRVESYVDDALLKNKKFMGFGHRMYKGPDPRSQELKKLAGLLAEHTLEQARWYAISEKLEKVVYEKKGLLPNVDFYSASVLYTIGIPIDLFASMFAIGRVAGWTAHVIEQYTSNRLIRPVSQYTGKVSQKYAAIGQRA